MPRCWEEAGLTPTTAVMASGRKRRDVPLRDITFDDVVGSSEQRGRHREAESLGCREVDHQIKLSRLFDRQQPRLLHWSQNRRIFVFEQDYQELGRHRLARVVTSRVNIVGAFVKRLSGRKGYGLFAVHAHDDAAF